MLPYLRQIISVHESKEKQEGFSLVVRYKDSVYESKEKQEHFSLAVRHTQDDLLLYLVNLKLDVNLRIIVIDFIIVKLIGVCSVIFHSRKRVFHVNIYVLVCYCYFELVILVILLFGTQQVLLELD